MFNLGALLGAFFVRMGIWVWVKRFFDWIAIQITRLAINQIIFWLISAIILYYSKDIIDFTIKKIDDFNNFILGKIIAIENMVFVIVNDVMQYIEDSFKALTKTIDGFLNTVLPKEVDFILSLVDFEVWLTYLLNEIAKSVSDYALQLATMLISPILDIVTQANNAISSIQDSLQKIMTHLSDALGELKVWNDLINKNTRNLFALMNRQIDDTNLKLKDMETIYTKIVNDSISHNNDIVEGVSEISKLFVVGKTITQTDIDAFNNTTSAYFTPIDVPTCNFFELYIVADIKDYLYDIKLKALSDLDMELKKAIKEATNLVLFLGQIKAQLIDIPQELRDDFYNNLPKVLRLGIKDILVQFILVVALKALYVKKKQIMDELQKTIDQIIIFKEQKKQEVIAATKQIKDDIIAYEKDLIQKLPDLLKPRLLKITDKLKQDTAVIEQQVLKSISQYVPDTSLIDHLVETFPNIPANVRANLSSNREDWTIGDIYRILVNYFDRNERLALIIHLADQDLSSTLADIYNKKQ